MLRPEEITDDNVRRFYENLHATPCAFNKRPLNDFAPLDDKRMIRQCLNKRSAPFIHEGGDYDEGFSQLDEDQMDMLITCEEEAARYAMVDKLGMTRLRKRIPALFFFPIDGDWGYSRLANMAYEWKHIVHDGKLRPFEIGIDPSTVESFGWLHNCGDIKHGPMHEKDDNPGYAHSISDNIEAFLGKRVYPIFTAQLYYGLDPENHERLFMFVDTSYATSNLKNIYPVAKNCADTAERYGIDMICSLYAEKHKKTERNPRQPGIASQAHLDPFDGRVAELEIDDISAALEKIKMVWQDETFMRMMVQYYQNKTDLFTSDPEQGVREIIREHLFFNATLPYVEEENEDDKLSED